MADVTLNALKEEEEEEEEKAKRQRQLCLSTANEVQWKKMNVTWGVNLL